MEDVNFSRIFHQLVSGGVINGSSVKQLLKNVLDNDFSSEDWRVLLRCYELSATGKVLGVEVQAWFRWFLWNGHSENKKPNQIRKCLSAD